MARLRVGWPRQVFAQVLIAQLLITTGVLLLLTGLFLQPLRTQLDSQAEHEALAIAQTTAADPEIATGLLSSTPDPAGPVQQQAERTRKATGALYVVVMDRRGIRWSHTDVREVGRPVSTSPSTPLHGHVILEVDRGTLGTSARAKVPLRDGTDRVIGAVSVGIAYSGVQERLMAALPGLLRYAGAALAVGAGAAFLVARVLRKRTHGVSVADIAALLSEREAMLHAVREGVIALDRHERVRLVNDEASRLLALKTDAEGRQLGEVLPPGRSRDVLTGQVTGRDLLTVRESRVLIANRMPTPDGGAVVTLRDRTEVELLGRELDSIKGLLDALRAQDHEHANRLHTVLGYLDLDMPERARDYVAGLTHARRASADSFAERVRNPMVSALLVGKAAIAAERGVSLRLSDRSQLPSRLVEARDIVTVLGNLIDNALDVVGGRTTRPSVEVEVFVEADTVVTRVSDNGPGVPVELRETIFEEGWSTKESPHHRGRGLGLAMVRSLAERYGGTARIAARAGGGAVFTVTFPAIVTGSAARTQPALAGEHRD
ncbi:MULTISPECIES: sensor histidine kinase [unclassified Streptomyces]|uniref:sensor histidine kinase n=1 Tax=unclassified Streptomyces TaxID=2593676 RepID=UPI00036D62DC|nr:MULTISPECIES: sensor histidine kinase [unclassified Streptomyces]MYQ75810.1 GHKL domain-containing protein [Streptomyces sp. SID4923]